MMRWAASLASLALQLIIAEASVAEGWGGPPHVEAHVDTTPAALLQAEDSGASEQVMLTAGGAIHRPSSIMRRHQEEGGEEHHHHHHHHGNTKAMFEAMDINGDGLVSNAEIKADMKRVREHSQVPKELQDMISSVNDNAEGGISYAEFKAAAKRARESHTLHHHHDDAEEEVHHHSHHRHSSIHKHHSQDRDELLEKAHFSTKTEVTTVAAWVTCGGHKAPNCEACPTTDSTGKTVTDHGSEWCHGGCVYQDNKCHLKGTVTVTGTVTGESKGYSTTPMPDLLNPNITAKDKAVVNRAAEDAIKEENIESAAKQKKEEKAAEERGFSWGKFWLVTIISFSVILGICAVVSVVALVVFCMMATPGPPPGKDDDEAEDAALAAGDDAIDAGLDEAADEDAAAAS